MGWRLCTTKMSPDSGGLQVRSSERWYMLFCNLVILHASTHIANGSYDHGFPFLPCGQGACRAHAIFAPSN